MDMRKLTVKISDPNEEDSSGFLVEAVPIGASLVLTSVGYIRLRAVSERTDVYGLAILELIPSAKLNGLYYRINISDGSASYSRFIIMPNEDVNLHDLMLYEEMPEG